MILLDFLVRVAAETWAILLDSAPYLLFGFLVAGLLHGFVPTEAVARHLGRGKVSSVVKAALFGIPLPLCSCGVIPAALNLRKKGANRGAVLSFLISTPETGVDSLALSYGLLGPVMTLFRPLAAFLTALVAGVSENFFGAERGQLRPLELSCGCAGDAQGNTAFAKIREGLRYAFRDLLKDLTPWLAVGFVLAGLISAAVPPGFVERYLGGPLAYLAMLAVGVPLYICATASTPIAAALLLKGLSPGAVLVFLLAGPATNAASLTALSGLFGTKTTARYLAAIVLVSVGMGALLDGLVAGLDLPAATLAASGAEILPPAVGLASALLLAVLALLPYLPARRPTPQACSGAT